MKRNQQAKLAIVQLVKELFWALAIGTASALTGFGEEISSQRLEGAQKGLAEASWPRKPDNRLSALSGKTKGFSEISPRFYGQEKEFQGRQAREWQKEAGLGSHENWEGADARGWEGVRWNRGRDWSGLEKTDEKFRFGQGLASEKTTDYRELERKSAPDWSSRPTSLGARSDGTLRMYEGRLTRVRKQVWREEQSARDLGPGRQEKFSPEEVETMLSQPVGEARGARAQSPAASPLAAAGN